MYEIFINITDTLTQTYKKELLSLKKKKKILWSTNSVYHTNKILLL